MKTKFISLLLILSILLSMFTVFSFADEAAAAEEETIGKVQEYLHYRSSFGDESDDIGTTPALINATQSSYELKVDADGNKYGYYTFNDSASNVYFQFSPTKTYTISTESLGYLIYEMDFNDFGQTITTNKFLEIHSGDGDFDKSDGEYRVAATDIINVANTSGTNYFYFNGSKSNTINIPSNEWVHIRIELSILSSTDTTYHLKCYIGDEYFEKDYTLGAPGMIKYLRFGSTNSTNQSFGLDNIVLYSAPENLSSYTEIGTISNALLMKVGAENAKSDGVLIELEHTPLLVDNEIYCPLDILESYTSRTSPSQYVVTFDDVEYIHIDDLYNALGVYAESYSMGLILISDDTSNLLDEDISYSAITEIMKTFVFNLPSASTLKEDVKNYTNNFDHPYLIADQDKFDYLRSIYNAGQAGTITDEEELLLYNYINSYVTSAEKKLKSIAGIAPNGVYSGILSNSIPKNSNYDNYPYNGYDNGGRVNSIPSGNLYYLAFAYQMTGQLNYARAAYDYSLALGDWNHWGPAHFLNCADAAAPFAIAYDWLYDAYKELESNGETSMHNGEAISTDCIVDIIFTHAIIPGYIQSNSLDCPWPGLVNSRYATTTNNWNAVCTSGMLAAALAIIGEETPTAGMTFLTQTKISSTEYEDKTVSISEIGNTAIHVDLDSYDDYASKLASMNMNSLMRNGLGEYAPDGSYVESPGYWAYGTNTFFRMVAVLMTATGDDYGFMDCWGIDTTSYFAIHSESSDYKMWNYNDGGVGAQTSEFFFFAGNFYGDDNLLRVRKKQLSSGKEYSLFDILFYDTSISGEPTLATEYYMEGIDGYTVRSSWDKGAIYAGIMGGPNKVSHGHMDAGVFVYHNKGKIWFHDLGSDQYNISYINDQGVSKSYFSNYELYRIGAEGHNVIAITSEQDTLPYGQSTDANPKIVKHYSSENGGYAIIDMSDSYGEHVTNAKRGMLFTDMRSVTVIQDEIVFNGTKTAYWFGHYNLAPNYVDDVKLSADKKTAFMISGDDILRVTIISDNDDLSFEIMDAYTYLLDITHDTDRAAMDLPNTEYNRDTIRKLAIKCENVETLNLAVVIEEVSDFVLGSSYTWTEMDNWTLDGAKTPETEYKFKADYDDVGLHIGSVNTSLSDEFSFNTVEMEDVSYATIASASKDASSSLSSIDFNFAGNEAIKLIRYKYAVVDFDISTDSKFITGASVGVNTSDAFVPLITLSDNKITANGSSIISEQWTKITVIIDTDSNSAYVYANNTLLSIVDSILSEENPIINSLSLQIPSGTVSDKKSTVSLDNISVRTLGTLYDDEALKNILVSGSMLSQWNDNLTAIATTAPLAVTGTTHLYNLTDLQSAVNQALPITLCRDCPCELNIPTPVSINTAGYHLDFSTDTVVLDIDGDYYRFETGSITVTWHIGDTDYIESYTSSIAATFKGTNSNIGKITETRIDYADGGTRFNYYTTGWANTPDGECLDSDEMIVTKDSCEFWLVNNKPLECLYVTVSSNGTITKGTSESALRAELAANNTNKRVVLCSDVEIMNTSALTLAKSGKNVYLNGYTLKHAQNDVHMFIFGKATADYNFYGPGNLVAAGSRTVFTTDAYSATNNYGVKIYNVNISIDTQLGDLRGGQHEFVNCTINHESAKTFLTLWDRNGLSSVTGTINGTSSNSAPLEGSTTNLITVKFTDCIINAGNTGTYSLVSYTNGTYSEVYFTNTSVTTPGAIIDAGYSSTYNPDVKLVFDGSSSVNAKSVPAKSAHIYENLVFDNGVTTNLNLDSVYIPDGAVLTNNYNSALPYRISSDYTTVKWLSLTGSVIHEEYVAVGVTPVLRNASVIEYLKSINAGTTEYAYETSEVASDATVNLMPIAINGAALMQGMDLSTDFAIEIYIRKDQLDSAINTVSINGIVITPTSYTIESVNGLTYYKYRITRINPANAGKIHNVIIEYTDGSANEVSVSVISYLEKLLMTSDDGDIKTLAVKTLKYIRSAYVYTGNSGSTDLVSLNSLIENYAEYDVLYASLETQYASTAPIKNAITGAKLYLSASAKFRFTLNPSYNGKITLRYMDNETTYSITDGKCNGLDYIQLELSAAELMSDVTITTIDAVITYNVQSYYTSLNTNDMALADMLFCLNEYSQAAKYYIEQ